MKRILPLILLSLSATASWPQKAPTPDARFKAITTAEDAWRKAQRQDDTDDPGEHIRAHLPKVDAATQQAKLDHWHTVIDQIDALPIAALSPAEQLNFRVFRAQIIVFIHNQKFRDYEMPVNSDSSFWGDEALVVQASFKSLADYTNYLSQLNEIPGFFADNIANMRAGLARGFTPPQVTLTGRDASIAAIANSKSAEDTVYFRPLLNMPASISAATQAQLRAQAATAIRTKIIPAYASLLTFWQADYVPHAVKSLAAENLPDGKHYYQDKIQEFTTTTLTPPEIHQIGLDEMAKIHAEMLATMKDAGFSGDLPAFLNFLRTDPQFYAKSPEDLLMRAALIAKEFDGVSSRFFGYLPRQRFAIKPVPADIAPFYTSARGGASTYWVNTYDLPSRGLYSLPALTLHESAPGHSLQLSISQEMVKTHKDLPKFRNVYISAYGEGWALYCERLGAEMGMYHTPYETFGMLSYQAWRAARLVVDTGIHSQGWTREQAQAYLHDNTALSTHEIETEVDRYISWPGQALSYYLGELSIEKSRHKAEAALGPKFNIRAFHDAVLELGPVPLPILEDHIDKFIARGGIGPYPEMEK
jgi:uncharacterized protein (DUF885 family)